MSDKILRMKEKTQYKLFMLSTLAIIGVSLYMMVSVHILAILGAFFGMLMWIIGTLWSVDIEKKEIK